jgi:hypothetical protein
MAKGYFEKPCCPYSILVIWVQYLFLVLFVLDGIDA